MPKVIAFPGMEHGEKVALYTQNHIYSGTVDRREPFPKDTGLWLNDVTVLPIKGQVSQPEILRLDCVCSVESGCCNWFSAKAVSIRIDRIALAKLVLSIFVVAAPLTEIVLCR